jgi:TldD protein
MSGSLTQSLFFQGQNLDEDAIKRKIKTPFSTADDGELYMEWSQSEYFSFDDGHLKNASFDISSGFGLRAVWGEVVGYAHSSEITEAALGRATEAVLAVPQTNAGGSFALDASIQLPKTQLYAPENPLIHQSFDVKVALLAEIDAYLRGKDPRVKQVSVSLSGSLQAVRIYCHNGSVAEDMRPLVRLNISVMVEENGRMESANAGNGGRENYTAFLEPAAWQAKADHALKQAITKLKSVNAPAGEMMVVLGAGLPGMLLHEAVGHGLEGDFNRKKTSTFSGRIGERVASPGVTVVDDGTIARLRGSLNIDDEGTPTQRNVLIEDGILQGYMFDRMNARLMGTTSTGNGRRESYSSQPMPRMTNTFMMPGNDKLEDMIKEVKNGIYAVHFGGGQVDITSGKFVFSASEAYLIENGEVTLPIKGATLIGNGPDILTRVRAIGDDLALDQGTCGKNGQKVAVTVGQPSLLIDKITVGGTA